MTISWSAPPSRLERSLLVAGVLLGLTFVLGVSVDWVPHLSAVLGGPGAPKRGVKLDVLDLTLPVAALRLLWQERSRVAGLTPPLRTLRVILTGLGVRRLLASVQVFLPLG